MRSRGEVRRMLEFLHFLEQWLSGESLQETTVRYEQVISMREYLAGWLDCDLTLPKCWCQELDMSRGATYGQAADRMLQTIDA